MSLFGEAATNVGHKLKKQGQTVAVAESSSGGLIAANLLSVPGSSRYFIAGLVIYSLKSRRALLKFDRRLIRQLQPMSEPMVLEFARAVRIKFASTWGVAELGAAGPDPTPYGHAAGTSVIAISGPLELTLEIKTGSSDRQQNMLAFSDAALALLDQGLTQF